MTKASLKVFCITLYGGLFVALCALSFELVRTLGVLDISMEPPLDPKLLHSNPPVYLISYADGPEVYLRNQHTLAFSALNRGIDFILSYRRHHLDPAFVKANRQILEQKKGAGYWLWKPWVILDAMKKAPEGAVIIYLDSGFMILEPIQPLIDLAQKHDIILLHWAKSSEALKMRHHTQKLTRHLMGCDHDACLNAPHLWAAFLVLRNTANARTFIQAWLEWCRKPECLMETQNFDPQTLPPDSLQEDPDFLGHAHDQTILGILAAQATIPIYRMPREEFDEMGVLFWHHRHSSIKDLTLLSRMRHPIAAFVRNLYTKWAAWDSSS